MVHFRVEVILEHEHVAGSLTEATWCPKQNHSGGKMLAMDDEMKTIRRARNERLMLLARSDTSRIVGVTILQRN